jgi:hypothetical protein
LLKKRRLAGTRNKLFGLNPFPRLITPRNFGAGLVCPASLPAPPLLPLHHFSDFLLVSDYAVLYFFNTGGKNMFFKRHIKARIIDLLADFRMTAGGI